MCIGGLSITRKRVNISLTPKAHAAGKRLAKKYGYKSFSDFINSFLLFALIRHFLNEIEIAKGSEYRKEFEEKLEKVTEINWKITMLEEIQEKLIQEEAQKVKC